MLFATNSAQVSTIAYIGLLVHGCGSRGSTSVLAVVFRGGGDGYDAAELKGCLCVSGVGVWMWISRRY